MQLLKVFLIFPVILLVIAITCYVIPLPDSFLQSWTSNRNLFAATVTGLFGLASLVWLPFYLGRILWQGAESFTLPFSEKGLVLRKSNYFARYYKGLIAGIPTEIILRPSYRLEPWRIEIAMQISTGTYLAIGNKKPLLTKSDCKPIISNDARLSDLYFFALDDKSAKRYLLNSEVQGALEVFCSNTDNVTGWEIYLEPDQVWASIRTYHPDYNKVIGWLESLFKLVLNGK